MVGRRERERERKKEKKEKKRMDSNRIGAGRHDI